MNDMNNKYCEGCGRHCPVTELRCERGERLARGGYKGNTEGEARPMPYEHRGGDGPRPMPYDHRGEGPRPMPYDHRGGDGPRPMPYDHRGEGPRPMPYERRGGRPPMDGQRGPEFHRGRPPIDGRPPMGGPHRRPMMPPRPRKLDYEAMDISEKIGCNVRELGGRLREVSHGGQLSVLTMLLENGPMTQRELTSRMAVQPGSASETIMKLEHSGLIERVPNEEDRRTALVKLTEEGEKRASSAAEKRRTRAESLFGRLSEDEQRRLLALLEKLNGWNEEESEHTAFRGANVQNV